ncbi:ABC transporter ATP-binding protein/permease [Amylibacter sp.]|nr:ABC transporter ATP-binding protein/permease [Amylibacter sp.]
MELLKSLNDYISIKYTITAVLAIIICSLVEFLTIASASNILSSLFSVSDVTNQVSLPSLFYLMLIFFIKGLFYSISNFIKSLYSVSVSKSILSKYLENLLENTFLRMQEKDIAAVTRDLTVSANSLSSGIIFPVLTLISELAILIGFLVFLHLKLGMLPIYFFIMFIIAVILINFLVNFLLRKLSKKRQRFEKNRVEATMDIYNCFSQIKLFGLEENYLNKYINQLKSLNKIEIIANQTVGFLVTWLEFILLLIIALAFGILFPFLNEGHFSNALNALGENVGFVLFGMRLIPMVGRVSTARAQFSFNSAIYTNFIDSIKQSAVLLSKEKNKLHLDLTLTKMISFNKLSVKIGNKTINYPDITLKKGEILLIKGESGSGKTTLLRCVANLIEAQKGFIDIGKGKLDLKNVKYTYFTNYVDQNAKIFSDTLSYNLTLQENQSSIDIERLNYLTETLRIKEVIDDKVGKLSQHISTNNNKFSGGELQRILLVRALYQDRVLTVFDEPTSALNIEIARMSATEILRFSIDKFVIVSTHTDHFDDIATTIVKL